MASSFCFDFCFCFLCFAVHSSQAKSIHATLCETGTGGVFSMPPSPDSPDQRVFLIGRYLEVNKADVEIQAEAHVP